MLGRLVLKRPVVSWMGGAGGRRLEGTKVGGKGGEVELIYQKASVCCCCCCCCFCCGCFVVVVVVFVVCLVLSGHF